MCLRIVFALEGGRFGEAATELDISLDTKLLVRLSLRAFGILLGRVEDIRSRRKKLSHLLGCDEIDVRLPAVKVFKKSIYNCLDQLLYA